MGKTEQNITKQLDEILEIFFGIDQKIMDLHQCSSDDFLSLNKTLKANHEKAKSITHNALTAFHKTGEEGNLKSIATLNTTIELLRTGLESLEKEVEATLAGLEIIEANLNLMIVPINNFRQNLASLKLLLSNVKLTNTFMDKSLQGLNENEAYQVDFVINKVKESCPVFEENIYNIRQYVKGIYVELSKLKETLFTESLDKLEVIHADLGIIEKHDRELLKSKSRVDEIDKNCKSNVGSIITNLQYHDIIRQKMEHIQHTHKLIIKELNGENKENDVSSANPFFLQIPQITEIQVAQLLHTNKEYQSAIDHISSKMIEIGSDMTTVARVCKPLNVFEHKGKSVDKETIVESFKSFVKETELSLNRYSEISNDVSLIQKTLGDLYDKFKDLEIIENGVEQRIIDKISFGNFMLSEEKETASQAQQILKLYADNHFEKNKIKTLFDSSQTHLREFVTKSTIFIKEQKGLEYIYQNVENALESFEQIEGNLEFMITAQAEILEKSMQVDMAGKEVVGKVKYYDFFEKTIDELVGEFDAINNIVKDHNLSKFDKTDTHKHLEQIEKYYTMKSERIIHNQALVKNGKVSIENQPSETTDFNQKGNDVEFF